MLRSLSLVEVVTIPKFRRNVSLSPNRLTNVGNFYHFGTVQYPEHLAINRADYLCGSGALRLTQGEYRMHEEVVAARGEFPDMRR
jgi:hypothetical protein